MRHPLLILALSFQCNLFFVLSWLMIMLHNLEWVTVVFCVFCVILFSILIHKNNRPLLLFDLCCYYLIMYYYLLFLHLSDNLLYYSLRKYIKHKVGRWTLVGGNLNIRKKMINLIPVYALNISKTKDGNETFYENQKTIWTLQHLIE